MKSELYELILDRHVHGMTDCMISTQNVCSIMREIIIKELTKARDKVFSDHGLSLEQNTAFILALDSFRSVEITKYSLALSMSQPSFAKHAVEALEIDNKVLAFDGAEKMAQALHEGMSEDTSKYIAETLNVKSNLFKRTTLSLSDKKEES